MTKKIFKNLIVGLLIAALLIYYEGKQIAYTVNDDVTRDRILHPQEPSRKNISDDVNKNISHDVKATSQSEDIISDECKVILDGDFDTIGKWRNSSNGRFPWRDVRTDDDVMNMTSNCTELKRRYKFPGSKFIVTGEEVDFPIAYSILAHENVNQILVLLSAIYREHNIHCIHLDAKASPKIYQALLQASKCFPNVFIATQRHSVIYAHVTRLLADVACMKDLLSVPKTMYDWKYLINLCSQDFPLRTNLEIVRQLKVLRGFNNIGGHAEVNDFTRMRTDFVYEIQNTTINGITQKRPVKTNQRHSPPPYNMTVKKNLAYNLYTRDFLQWALLDSKVGQALLNWSKDTYSPDEHFWLMLHTYPGAPGGSNTTSWFQLARQIKWWSKGKDICHGEWRHQICVFGAEDIHELTKSSKLFVNKLDIAMDSTGPTCLRQWLDERNLIEQSVRRYTNPDQNPDIPRNAFFT